MKKWICLFFLVQVALTGCSLLGHGENTLDSDYYFYHIDKTKTALVKVA